MLTPSKLRKTVKLRVKQICYIVVPSQHSLLSHFKNRCKNVFTNNRGPLCFCPSWSALSIGDWKRFRNIRNPKTLLQIEQTKIYLSLTRFDIGADFLAGSALKWRTKWSQQTKYHSWIICLHIFRFDSHQMCPIIIIQRLCTLRKYLAGMGESLGLRL